MNTRTLPKDRRRGFTIIEVLIVLAIAGLILLVVFLAVPALQRNSRNNARRSDVSRIAAAAREFVTNNGGKVPSTYSECSSMATSVFDLVNSQGFSGYNLDSGGVCTSVYIEANYLTVQNFSPSYTGEAYISPLVDNKVAIENNAKCSTATAGRTVRGAPGRMAIMYTLETSGGSYTAVCQEI